MRSTMPILLSLALSLASSSALADMAGLSDEEKNVQEQIKKLINGVREKNRAAILSTISRQYKQSSPNGRSAPQSSTGMRVSPASGSSVAAQPPIRDGLAAFLAQNRKDSSFQQSNCQGFGILLRQDWKDMGYGSCPDTVDKATGAQLAYSNDRIVNNSVWSLHGTAAVLYSAEVPNKPDEYDLYHRSLGAYVTVNRLMNSAISQAKSNVDTLAYGGVVLFALSTPVDVGWTHWFRVRGGGVEDDLKNTTAANVTGEWSPVNPNWYVHYPFPFRPFGISMRFDPELIAQYDEVTGKKQILQFNNRHQSPYD